MHARERRRQGPAQAGDVRQPRGPGEPRADAPHVADGQQGRHDRRDPPEARQTQPVDERGGRLRHAVGDAHRFVGQRHEHRHRAEHVDHHDADAGEQHAAAQRCGRVVDLPAQRRGQLQPRVREGHRRKQVDGLKIHVGRHQAGGREARRAAVRHHHPRGEKDEDQRRHPGAESAHVLQPLADVQADDVQGHGDPQADQRDDGDEDGVVPQVDEARAADVRRDRGRRHHQRGIVEEIVDPVPPPRQEPLARSERPSRPAVQAAGARVDVRQLTHRQRRRDEEHQHRHQPQRQRRDPELTGGGREPA